MGKDDSLKALRDRLDALDRSLVEGLAERQRIVAQVAAVKRSGGTVVRDRAREEAHLGKLVAIGRDVGLDAWFVTRVYREVFDHSLRAQQAHLAGATAGGEPLTVAIQGTHGSYSSLAADHHFSAQPRDLVLQGHDTFEQMMEAVRSGAADYGMLPIENTTAGSINPAYDLLLAKDLAVVGEEIQRVDHCLIGLEPVPVGHIRRIYSQAPALAQCQRFLASLDHCHVESFTDTAMAVDKVLADQDLAQAAIASEEAARLRGLHVLKRQIADQRENYTRFLVVAREPVEHDPRIDCKTSIIFATGHEEGALLKCLNALADHHLNLTKLESRPRPNVPWEYVFYVDFEGSVAEDHVQQALAAVAARTRFLKVLGSYPARNTHRTRPATPAPAPLPKPRPSQPTRAVTRLPAADRYRLGSRAHRAEDTVIRVGEVLVGGSDPVVLVTAKEVTSSAEIDALAAAAAAAGAHLLRADLGGDLGYEGLDLLEAAGHAVGLPVATRVAHPGDVERVARQADLLVVASQDMQSYALLEAVGAVDRPVVLERGRMAAVDEWLAAAETILARGNQQVILCERGIRTFETATRQTLDLTVVPVLRERSHLPVLVDPSQASGAGRWTAALSAAALAAGASGVVLALGDGDEALDPEALQAAIGGLRA